MKTIEDAILKIKENPNKYIGQKSLERLDLFIFGYMLSQLDSDGTYSKWLSEFSEFIVKKYNIYYNVRYSQIIRLFSVSDEHAFDKFYELLDEFYQEKSEGNL